MDQEEREGLSGVRHIDTHQFLTDVQIRGRFHRSLCHEDVVGVGQASVLQEVEQ